MAEKDERKTHKISEQDFAKLQQVKAIEKEDLQHGRLRTIEQHSIQIRMKNREIDFKKKQKKDGESVEKHDAFIDGKKPLFMLDSDIERINFDIDSYIEVIKGASTQYLSDGGDKEKISEILKKYNLSIEV